MNDLSKSFFFMLHVHNTEHFKLSIGISKCYNYEITRTVTDCYYVKTSIKILICSF